jgi:hypothetical protein
MMRHICHLTAVVLLANPVWAASDPFVGGWKVNPSKSKLNDEMKVEAAGANRYTLTFGPDEADTVVADGSDQPALSGTTLSIAKRGLNSWEVVRKIKGRMLLRAQWTLSGDGELLHDDFTQYLPDGMTLLSQPLPDGSTLFLPYLYRRTAGSSGFVGTWDSESASVRAGIELTIGSFGGGGLSFKRSDEEIVKRIELDGKDHPDLDSKGTETGAACSGRRANARKLEIIDKFKGQITGTRQIELSADLKTLTIFEQLVGQDRPKSVLVFDRE